MGRDKMCIRDRLCTSSLRAIDVMVFTIAQEYSVAIQVSMLWASMAFIATVFKKVDLPEALEPVSKTPPSAAMLLRCV